MLSVFVRGEAVTVIVFRLDRDKPIFLKSEECILSRLTCYANLVEKCVCIDPVAVAQMKKDLLLICSAETGDKLFKIRRIE